MGKTSNSAKQRWNGEHYTQVKVAVNPGAAKAFKEACRAAGVSMAGELERQMLLYAGSGDCTAPDVTPQTPADANQLKTVIINQEAMAAISVKTLKDRRKAITLIKDIIERLIDSETEYMDNMPVNMQNGERYEMAAERAERLAEALEAIDCIGT